MYEYLLQSILKRLLEIKNGINIDKDVDIWGNLDNYFTDIWNMTIWMDLSEWLDAQIAKWPECYIGENGTKSVIWPVGGEDEYWNEKEQGTIWENPKRPRLLDFVISQINQELKQMKR